MSFLHFILNLATDRVSAVLLSAFLQWCPAFLCSCTPTHALRPRIAEADYIDVFFFDTLSSSLDSYQRLRAADPLYAMSSVGAKRVVALAVRSRDPMEWAHVRTYSDLCKYSFSLKDDSPDNPLLAGEAVLDNGISRVADIGMNTCLAKIELGSIACDFTGTPYTGHGFENTIIYIQYAGVEARPFGPNSQFPVSSVNHGFLDSAAVMQLPYPEMLLQKGVGNIWRETKQADRVFWCYGNDVPKGTIGRPVTRLVLEGDVGENHCYYPIELPGLKAGQTLRLSVRLLRIGSPDPDLPVSSADIIIDSMVVPWEDEPQREEVF